MKTKMLPIALAIFLTVAIHFVPYVPEAALGVNALIYGAVIKEGVIIPIELWFLVSVAIYAVSMVCFFYFLESKTIFRKYENTVFEK